jgi:DNA-binding NarL/FixJ family response regulator
VNRGSWAIALEKEIVSLVAQGHTNHEIAEKLCLAEQTVRNYLSAIYAKTKAKNRVELAMLAVNAGLIDSAREK